MIEKPRLLITRFSPHAEFLAEELNDVGFFSIAQPLLTVTAIEDTITLNNFKSGLYDVVIAVSGNAVKYSQQQMGDCWPTTRYIAVGDSTQKLLSEATQQIVLYPKTRFDSEGLLDLDVLQSVKDKRILILRGEGGRDLIEDTLIERGAKVEFFQTYKRIKLDLDGQQLVDNWQQASINGAIISSIEILNQLFVLVPNKYFGWLSSLTIYAPSQRINDHAISLGLKHVKLLPSLRTDHIIKFFKANNGKSS